MSIPDFNFFIKDAALALVGDFLLSWSLFASEGEVGGEVAGPVSIVLNCESFLLASSDYSFLSLLDVEKLYRHWQQQNRQHFALTKSNGMFVADPELTIT